MSGSLSRMITFNIYRSASTALFSIFVFGIFVFVFGIEIALAQTTPPTTTAPRPTNPVQQDATRPPGTTQGQPVPRDARPATSDPTAPPSTSQPATSTPPVNTTPVSPVAPSSSSGVNPAPSPADGTSGSLLRTPLFQNQQARPVPPLPDLSRLGVASDNMLALTLNEAIRRALENNNDIEIARDDVRFAESTLRALEGVYDPVMVFNPQINNRVSPVSSALGGSDQSGTVTTTDLNFNPSVTRQFSRGGGNYTFFFNNTRETTSSTFSNLNPFYSSNLGVTFTQPLLRDRSIDRFRRDIRIQRRRLEQTDADFRRRTTEVITQVQRAYWDLVFALRDVQIRQQNFELTRENFRQTEARVAVGAAAPLSRAEVQTELSNRENELLAAVQNVSFAENVLKQLILRDPLAPEWSAQIVPSDQPTFDPTPVNLQDALREARENRPELTRLRIQEQISDIDIQFFRNQARPRIDIESTLSTTGLAGTPVAASGVIGGGGTTQPTPVNGQIPLIGGDPATSSSAFLLSQINLLRAAQGLPAAAVPLVTAQTSNVPADLVGGYGQTLRNLLSFETRNIVVGVRIEIPFRNRTAEANLAGARIARSQLEAQTRLQEQAVEVEVRNAAQSVETARRRVLTARAARESAEIQLEGERRLNEVGRSTAFFLFQRENQLAAARNAELRAETDYNKALADLQRATSSTLRANNVIVSSPVGP
jgi:outer membrane protein